MTKAWDTSVLDGSLDVIATGNELHVVTGDPADRPAVIAASLVSYPLTGGDFTKSAGVTDGRRVTVAAQSGNNSTQGGTADHYCIIDATTLLAKTEADGQTVSPGNPLNVGDVDFENADPA